MNESNKSNDIFKELSQYMLSQGWILALLSIGEMLETGTPSSEVFSEGLKRGEARFGNQFRKVAKETFDAIGSILQGGKPQSNPSVIDAAAIEWIKSGFVAACVVVFVLSEDNLNNRIVQEKLLELGTIKFGDGFRSEVSQALELAKKVETSLQGKAN